MKKTFIAASMLGIFAAGSVSAADEAVNVTFIGEVKELACTVQVGGANNVVNLGLLDAKANAEGTKVPVTFRFADCQSGTKLKSIKLTGATVSDQDPNKPADQNLANGILATDRPNVTVHLMNSTDGTFNSDPVKFDDPNGMNLDNGGVATPYFAQLKASAQKPAPGSVSTTAVFTVTYN